MARKVKKIYKPRLKIAPKASLNRKWTVWRQAEMKNRQASALDEMKKLALSALWKDLQTTGDKGLDFNQRMRLHYRIWELNKRSAAPRSKNYCHYIGRSRSVNRKLFMSRHVFRKFARFGMLPGFTKERC